MIALVPIVTLCRNIAAHWKIEAFCLAIITSISLMANQFTAPKVLAAMVIIGDWSDAISKQMIFSTAIAAVFSMGTWWLQKSVLAKRTLAAEASKAEALKIANFEREEKERATKQRDDLDARVKALENATSDAREKVALMGQSLEPIQEAMLQTLIKSLTHPSLEFKEGDDLLAKVAKHIPLSDAEMERLKQILKIRETDPSPEVTDKERLGAKMLPDMLDLVAIEKEALNVVTKLQVVTISEQKKPSDAD